MKKMTFRGLALSLLIAAGAPHQGALRLKGEHLDNGETMTDSDAEPEAVEPMALGGWRDPSDLSDEDAIRLIRTFVGTPWDTLGQS